MRRSFFTAVLAALAAFAAARAWGQAYPNRPVRVVVAAATGGPDLVARIVAAELTTQLGQSFFVENQPGANGIVGANIVAKAAPDEGGGPAAAALVSGEVQAMLVSPAPIIPHYRGNKVRVLAYSGEKRNAAAPEVPLMKEAGVDYTYDGGWLGMFAPARTPPEILEKIAAEVRTAMQKPAVLERFAKKMARLVGVKPE